MRVVVIGAAGRTGRCVVDQLLLRRHHVTVLVRPAHAASFVDGVRVCPGDATVPADLASAIDGTDAVVSTLGAASLGDTGLQTAFIAGLVAEWVERPAARFVNLSGWGAGGSAATTYPIMALQRATILRGMYDDKDRAERVLLGSELPFVNVRPARLTDGAATGRVVASLDGRHVPHRISRADTASFVVDQLEDDSWLRRSPIIGAR